MNFRPVKLPPAQIVIVALGVLFLAASLPMLKGASPGQKQIEQSIENAYKGKTLRLRNFCVGPTQRFDSNGGVVGAQDIGPWTLYSVISVDSLKLKSNLLEIHAHRLFLHYLPKDKAFRSLRGGGVRIRIDLDHELSSVQELEPLLGKIFVKPGEDFSQLVPQYWKEFCSHLNDPDWSKREMEQASAEAKAIPKDGTPPFPIRRPEPPYSREAREARINGNVLLAAAINQNGHVTDVVIIRPLGMGLDERAVETLRTWTFKPAQLNGHARAVRVVVETTFRLSVP